MVRNDLGRFRGAAKGINLHNCAVAAFVLLLSGGCAVLPAKSQADLRPDGVVVERDQLAQAVAAVERTPWPKPEPVSLLSRLAGGGERMSFSDVVAVYLDALSAYDNRAGALLGDAGANLADAAVLSDAAMAAASAPRLSMNDVILLETAIGALRENRRVYEAAAKALDEGGDAVDPAAMETIAERYGEAIRTLGDAADQLAERIENDRSRTYAAPNRRTGGNFSGI